MTYVLMELVWILFVLDPNSMTV